MIWDISIVTYTVVPLESFSKWLKNGISKSLYFITFKYYFNSPNFGLRVNLLLYNCVSAVFHLAFLHVTSILFSWSLAVLSWTLTPVLTHLFFMCFVAHCLFSSNISLSFLSWYFDVFYHLPESFPFLIFPFLLYFHQNLDTND